MLHSQFILGQQLLGVQLRHGLLQRSDVQQLEQLKVLKTNAETARMQCPSIKKRLAFYEGLN
jgi:hypothetical protein